MPTSTRRTKPDPGDVDPLAALDAADKATPDLGATPDAPPTKAKRGRPRGGSTTARKTPAKLPPDFEARVTEFYVMVGFTVGVATRDQRDAMAIAGHAEEAAHAWTQLAATSPAVRAAIERMMTGAGLGAVVMVHGRIAVDLARNRGIVMPWDTVTHAAEQPETGEDPTPLFANASP